MECLEGALKSSFRRDLVVLKTTHLEDEFWDFNGQIGVSGGEDFSVDDLLDLSKDDSFVQEDEETTRYNNGDDPSSVANSPPQTEHRAANISNSVLCLPEDDVADLEWLSHFVEDSFTNYPLTFPATKYQQKPSSEPEANLPKKPSFETPVQTKARSKRTRTGGRVWCLGSPPSLAETPTSSSSTSLSTISNQWLIYTDSAQTAESFLAKPPVHKKNKRMRISEGANSCNGGGGRRCGHCLTQKTPQWRTGPLGPKTLCNACGVRYKSGRLLPEYRPVCSPTFSSDVHSNNHRKVLEMRKKKEVDSGSDVPVQSF